MKKLPWYLVSAAVAAFVLGGALLLALNLYVQSRAVQLRIRQALSARLRMPVTLRKTTFSPWDGLRIDTVAARPTSNAKAGAEDPAANATFLTAESFRVRFDWGALLQRQFVVEDVLLDQPRLSWAQDKTNRWHLPVNKEAAEKPEVALASVPPSPSQSEAETVSPAPVDASLSSTTPSNSPIVTVPSPNRSKSGDERSAPAKVTSVEKFRLRHGNMDFLNYRRGLLGHLEEVNLDGHLPDPQHARGHATVETATLPRVGVRLTQVQTEFRYAQEDGLELHNAGALLAGGRVAADCFLRTMEPGTPFNVTCRIDNVGVDQFIKEAGGKLGLVDGRLQGDLKLNGYSDGLDRCAATGKLELVDTQLRNLPLLQTVGDALRIEDLRHPRFKTARLDYQLTGNTVKIQPLVLASSNLQITAQGDYRLNEDRLDLQARLVVDPEINRQLPKAVEKLFSPCGDEAPGSRYVDFTVGGSLSKPTSDLYERMIPGAIDSLLDGLFHSKPKRSKASAVGPASPPTNETDER